MRIIAVAGWPGQALWASSAEEVAAMVRAAVRGLARPLRKPVRAKVRGKSRTCWRTVQRAVRQGGGRLVPGWSVVRAEPRLPQRNRWAGTCLNAHCIWYRDGEWYECIPERHVALGFVPGPVPSPDACVEFYDSPEAVERAGLPLLSLDLRPITQLPVVLDNVQ
jgi:hypothetical protein